MGFVNLKQCKDFKQVNMCVLALEDAITGNARTGGAAFVISC